MIAALCAVVLMHAPVAARADTVRDTVYVVSNRQRTARGFSRTVTDSLWHGIYVAQLVMQPRGTADSGRATESSASRALSAMRVQRVDSLSLTGDEWRARLRHAARDTSAEGAALVYVHGYSSSPAHAVSQGVQVRARGGHRGPLVLFLWPTHDLYVAPPTPTRAYRDDAQAAAQSGPALARVLRAVDSLAPSMVVVAHSMGSRVTMDALITDASTRTHFASHPLRALGIFSPDVGAEQFRSVFAPQLPAIARRVALYGAATDYLLGASVLINGERRASGITRRGAPLAGIELIDETSGARAEPLLLSFISPRHSVRWASAALADFFSVVVAGAEPSCRVSAGGATAVGEGRWRLLRDSMPRALPSPKCVS